MHRCMGWTGSFVPAHSGETSADKRVDLPPIYPPHLHLRVRSVLDFALFSKLVRPEYALYAVPVRQAGSSLRTSFGFHLTMDTLVFRLQFLLTSLYRTFTDESTHMPRILNQNHRLSRWYAPRLQGVCTGSPIRALNDSPIATILQASAKAVFFMPYYSCYP